MNQSRPIEEESGTHAAMDERSIPGLLKDLVRESQELARRELALARRELDERVTRMQHGATAMLGAGALLSAGLVMLLAAPVLALSAVMAPWLAALIVGVVACIASMLMLSAGRKRTNPSELTPTRTIAEAERTASQIKERVR